MPSVNVIMQKVWSPNFVYQSEGCGITRIKINDDAPHSDRYGDKDALYVHPAII